jgi:hypothetical protein
MNVNQGEREQPKKNKDNSADDRSYIIVILIFCEGTLKKSKILLTQK